MATGTGTKDDPWVLKTPPGTSDYTMYRDDSSDPPTIVCMVGSTKLLYHGARDRRAPRVAQGAGRLGAVGRGG